MAQPEMRIVDARSAASAFVALGKLTGSAKLPADRAELATRLQRVTGRARPLATALGRYVETNGIDALRSALNDDGAATLKADERVRSDSNAAAVVSRIDFEELDRTAVVFAASGLY